VPALIGVVVGYVVTLLAEIGVTGLLAETVAEIVVYSALAYGVGKIAQALGPSPPKGTMGTDITASTVDPLAGAAIVLGHVRAGGVYVIPPFNSGNNGELIHVVYALAGHQIDSFGNVYIGQDQIMSSEITAVTGSANDGLITGTRTVWPTNHWVRRYIGTASQTVDYILSQAFPSAFTSDFRGRGIAYAAVQLKYDDKSNRGQLPQISFEMNGARVYDPRLDSTNGGSGSQRYTDSTTWVYSNNPALLAAWYLIDTNVGMGYDPAAEIYWPSVTAAANICDATVNAPAPNFFGLLNWTHSSAIVTGVGTTFLSDILAGNLSPSGANWVPASGTVYILGPDSNWYTLSSIQSQTQLTLTGNFTGTTSNNQVGQWNTAASGTATPKRYSCNTVLNATNDPIQNLRSIVDTMLGGFAQIDGVWKVWAGAYDSPVSALFHTDFVGPVQVQACTPRTSSGQASTERYNGVRVQFVNPAKNWQGTECYPRANDTYKTADGGERIWKEVQIPACTDEYQAQRLAEFILRASRNQIVVSGILGPKWIKIGLRETCTLTWPDLGWASKIFRVVNYSVQPTGLVSVVLQEEQSTDWTDLVLSDYNNPSKSVIPAVNPLQSGAPTTLTATAAAGSITFAWTPPVIFALGARYSLMEATTNSYGAASEVWNGTASSTTLTRNDTVTRYYWVRVIDLNGNVAGPYPAVNGISGVALPLADWLANLVGNAALKGLNTIYKNGGSDSWDSSCYTSFKFFGGVGVRFRAIDNSSTTYAMVGLSHQPASGPSYTVLDFAFYLYSGTVQIYENGTQEQILSGFSIGDTFEIKYDGITARYYWNGVLQRATPSAGLTLTPMVCLYRAGAQIADFQFGSLTTFSDRNYTLTDSWVVGATSGNVGNYAENVSQPGTQRIYLGGTSGLQLGPYGGADPLYYSQGRGVNGADPGWINTKDIQGLDPNKSYRSLVWVNVGYHDNGELYHGCDSGGATLNLDGSANSNPYFTNGIALSSLTLGNWYLMVGYIHGNGYTGPNTGNSGIWDPTTGFNIAPGQDYKMASGVNYQMHRAFLYYTTTTAPWLTFAKPRFEEVNGLEPSIPTLLSPAGGLAYLDQVDTDNIVNNAATDVSKVETASAGLSTSTDTLLQSITVGSYSYDTNAVITAMGNWAITANSLDNAASIDLSIRVYYTHSGVTSVEALSWDRVWQGSMTAAQTMKGAYARERSVPLVANDNLTAYFYGNLGYGSSATSGSMSKMLLKAEIIKK